MGIIVGTIGFVGAIRFLRDFGSDNEKQIK